MSAHSKSYGRALQILFISIILQNILGPPLFYVSSCKIYIVQKIKNNRYRKMAHDFDKQSALSLLTTVQRTAK